MNKSETSPLQLEILISTVNKTSFDFLHAMFIHSDFSNFQILIINQTSEGQLLHSEDPKIRIVNSFEKGLSKSRNLAIDTAVGDICLFADDDVVFMENFEKRILDGYNTLPKADLITFKTLTTDNKPYSNYPKNISKLNSFYRSVLSIEITFRRQALIETKVRFDELFGLGSTFQDSENHIFLNDLRNQENFEMYFVPEYIVIHQPFSSSDDIASDRFVFARSALNYKLYGMGVYIYISKLLFYLLRKKLIRLNEINHKFKVAQSGIKTYKQLSNA